MKKFTALALAGAAMTLITGSAQAASTLVINSDSSTYTGNTAFKADITKTSNPQVSYDDVSISPQTVTGVLDGKAVSLFTYCVDIFQYSGTGTFDVVSLSSYLNNTTKTNQIAALISAHSAQSTVAVDTAVQLAIWEILYESGNNAFNINSGAFKISDLEDNVGGNVEATLLSNTASFLADAADGNPINSKINLYVAKNSNKQDLLFWTTSPVPEPATWGMMLLGLGAVGAAMRSRRTTAAVSFS